MTIDASTLDRNAFATYVAPSGGAPEAISVVRNLSASKATATFDADTNILTRKLIDFTVRDPVLLSTAPGGYTQSRQTVLFKFPFTLANGNRTVNTLSMTMSIDPEAIATDLPFLRLLGSQVLGLASFDSFWEVNSLV